MRRALELAERGQGQTSPNPLVGAVIVKDGTIVGEGYHARFGEAHAEVEALKAAGPRARGADLYVTLEPCSHTGHTPPCVDALRDAGIARVFAAMIDPDARVCGKGIAALEQSGIETKVGLLAQSARRLNRPHIIWNEAGRPQVTLKWAMSLDGKVATHTGSSLYLTGVPARTHAHRLRADHDAIAVGVGTVLADDPQLTVRLTKGRQPLRVIFDSDLRTPPQARCLDGDAPTLLLTRAPQDSAKAKALRARGADIVHLQGGSGHIDVEAALQELARRSVRTLLVEGGPGLASSFWDCGLIDRVCAFTAPLLLGGAGARSPIAGAGRASPTDALRLTDVRGQQFGDDFYVEGWTRDV